MHPKISLSWFYTGFVTIPHILDNVTPYNHRSPAVLNTAPWIFHSNPIIPNSFPQCSTIFPSFQIRHTHTHTQIAGSQNWGSPGLPLVSILSHGSRKGQPLTVNSFSDFSDFRSPKLLSHGIPWYFMNPKWYKSWYPSVVLNFARGLEVSPVAGDHWLRNGRNHRGVFWRAGKSTIWVWNLIVIVVNSG